MITAAMVACALVSVVSFLLALVIYAIAGAIDEAYDDEEYPIL